MKINYMIKAIIASNNNNLNNRLLLHLQNKILERNKKIIMKRSMNHLKILTNTIQIVQNLKIRILHHNLIKTILMAKQKSKQIISTEQNARLVEESSMNKHYKNIRKFARKSLFKKEKYLMLRNKDKLKMRHLNRMNTLINLLKKRINLKNNNKTQFLNKRNLQGNKGRMLNGKLKVKCSDKQ